MSLDVSLTVQSPIDVKCGSGIFLRENGANRELSIEEVHTRYPEIEIHIPDHAESYTVFERNITHNLNVMAREAGVYLAMWRPEELSATKAKDLIEPLSKGLELLLSYPERFKLLNPSNGWGDYDGLVSFVSKYMYACKEYPEATIEVSR